MSKRNAIIATFIAVAVLAAVPLADASPGGRRGPGGPFGNLRHIQEELDLSQAQTDQIRGIFAGLRTQNDAYRSQLRGGFREITETLLKNPNDVAAAQAMLDQRTSAHRAMKANRLAALSKALNVLTPAQRAELAQMIEERDARRRGRARKGSTR